jgi:hypothetical protein
MTCKRSTRRIPSTPALPGGDDYVPYVPVLRLGLSADDRDWA